jgi:chemotaxis protein MotB
VARRRRRRTEDSGGGDQYWLTTYADMITLLFCFFVLLFAFSSIDVQKFQAIMSSFQGAIGILDHGRSIQQSRVLQDVTLDSESHPAIVPPTIQEIRQLQAILGDLEALAGRDNIAQSMTTSMEERGIVIRFADRVLFDLGRAEIKPEGERILISLGEWFSTIPNHIRIEGHTDNLPINTPRFPSNWELSTARATNVLRFLLENTSISPAQFSVAGYGEYRPIADNDSEEGRRANRRVDIVLLRLGLTAAEPGLDFLPERETADASASQ